jgi:hypothetical protein
MGPSTLAKLGTATAAEICSRYKLSRHAKKLFLAEQTPSEFLGVLMQAKRYVDVFDFLAHALPAREAVWWACLAVRHAQGNELPAEHRQALRASVEWVLQPDEPRRRAAEAAGQAADYGTPAGSVALAVYGSGGSLTPANLPEVPAEPFMYAKAVAGSLALASVQGDPLAIPDLQRELAELGLAIADGKVACPVAFEQKTEESSPPEGAFRKRP